jgi:four helix bundle protein
MANKNIGLEKSFDFGLRMINLYKYLIKNKKEFVISKQILRSGTSIGANLEEAIGGQSEKDFFAKICIAYKEARETAYWLKLLRGGGYLSEIEYKSISGDCEELCRILGKTKITMSEKKNKK